MSSMFMLPTSDQLPDPSGATERVQLEQVKPRSSSLEGAVTLEFTSSPQRWFSPADSYMLISFNLEKSNAGANAWESITHRLGYGGATLAMNAGAAVFSQITLTVNGTLVGQMSNPAQVSGLLARTELSRDYCETVGSVEALAPSAAQRATDFLSIQTLANAANRTAFQVVYKPPFGFLRTMKAYPGARITLTCTVSPDFPNRMLTGIVAGQNHTIAESL